MPTLPILLCLLLLLSCSDGGRSRHALDALEARNQSDSLLTDSVLALRLADYFDRHGTANERLHAHYLLARTWADLGQSPRALDEFHKAAEQADTTSSDCDYRQIMKVHGQIAGLFCQQMLMQNALAEYERIIDIAKKQNDTLMSILAYEQMAQCYYVLGKEDSAFHIYNRVHQLYQSLGDTLRANTSLGPIIYEYLSKGQYSKAGKYLHDYEYNSLLTPTAIAQNTAWQKLYIYKGMYYAGLNKEDSAVYYLNQVLKLQTDYNNRAFAYRELYRYYKLRNHPDSTSKYAILYAQSNDSVVNLTLAGNMQKMQALYDYSSFQIVAEQKTIEANKANYRNYFLLLIVLASFFATILIIAYMRNRRAMLWQRVNAKYFSDIMMFNKIKSELESQGQKNRERLELAEEELSRLRKSIAEMQSDQIDPDKWNLGDALLDSNIVAKFHKAAAQGKSMPDKAWDELITTTRIYIPEFSDALDKFNQIKWSDRQICILTKLRFIPTEIGTLLNMSIPAVGMRRKRLLMTMFGINGSTTDFDRKVRTLAI